MPSAQVEAVRRNLNSVSKNWAFAGDIALIGHKFAMGLADPRKPFKFKEIHVVVPKHWLYDFHEALFKKGYLVNTTKSGRRFIHFKNPGQKRPLVLYVQNEMPRTVSYVPGNRLVALDGVSNGSPEMRRLKNFHRFIHNSQPNVN